MVDEKDFMDKDSAAAAKISELQSEIERLRTGIVLLNIELKSKAQEIERLSWRPIEAAPKCKPMLCWHKQWEFPSVATKLKSGQWVWHDLIPIADEITPTHYKPLPGPPEE